jgi:transposase
MMILRPEDPRQIEMMCRADWVRDEPLVQIIDQVVQRLDLTELYARYSEAGRPFYDPAMQLKLWLLGYCDGVHSSRALARHICYDIRYLYFTGSLRPDFRTLSRFRQHNVDLLAGYFAQVIRLFEAEGLTDVSLVALDGTKLRASSSSRRTRRGSDALVREVREHLDRDIATEATDDADGAADETDARSGVPAANDAQRPDSQSVVPDQATDPDARFMKTGEGGIRPCYNAQVAVDANQLILAADVSTNADDSVVFRSMVDQVQQAVAEPVTTVLADGGYYSGRNVKYAADHHLDLYMPISTSGRVPNARFTRHAFTYDADTDRYQCPQGIWLHHSGDRSRNGITSRVYRAPRRACRRCKMRPQCTSGVVRTLQISEIAGEEQRMTAKLSTADGQHLYDQRKQLVEPVFGNMKFNLGFVRFGLRGLRKVRGEFSLLCLAHNLKKLARWGWRLRPVQTAMTCAIAIRQFIHVLLLSEFRRIISFVRTQRRCFAY